MKKIFIILSLLLTILSYSTDINRINLQEQAKIEEQKRIESVVKETYDKTYLGYVEAQQLISKMNYRDWRSISSDDINKAVALIKAYKYGNVNGKLDKSCQAEYDKKLDDDVETIDIYANVLGDIRLNEGIPLEVILKNGHYPLPARSPAHNCNDHTWIKFIKKMKHLQRNDELSLNINSFIDEANSIIKK